MQIIERTLQCLILWLAGLGIAGAALSTIVSPHGVVLTPAFPGVSFSAPVWMVQAPGDRDHWYVLEQEGVIKRVTENVGEYTVAVVADLRDRVEAGGEKGLLSMAFHPAYPARDEVFVSYTGKSASGTLTSYVSRFRVKPADGRLDSTSEQRLLQVAQPFGNHNGGHIAFGADGYLYIGLGDGGAAGDPHNHGQNIQTLLGALLRLDIDHGEPYAIPPDNPLVQGSSGRPEIYAWGLRNPWRWSFDRVTGELWLADVGQDRWEEVNRISKGGNYGWNIREGRHCYRGNKCRHSGLIEPVIEYSHQLGQSITGGYVYRGGNIPLLQGHYLYGDFVSGLIWAFAAAQQTPLPILLFDNTGLHISSFAQDHVGELYVIDYYTGVVYRLDRAP